MKRCTNCYRYALGDPTYCPFCGRSFHKKLCARGHANPRSVTFCAQCGSSDLSTPAPPATLGFQIETGLMLLLVRMTPVFVVALVGLAVISVIDWPQLFEAGLPVLLMAGLAYWVVTLLPGPVRRAGRTVARRVGRSMKRKPRSR